MQKQFVPLFQEDLDEKDIINLNPLVLSFIGDSVQTLYIRSKLGINSSAKTGKLHLLASKQLTPPASP